MPSSSSPWRSRSIWLVLAGAIAFLQELCSSAAAAQQTDTLNTLNLLIDRPSTLVSPVVLSIAGVQYTIPRNYIIGMDNWNGGPQVLVSLKVTFPGFEPLTAKTTACLSSPPLYRPPGCTALEFYITTPYPQSDEEGFNNVLRTFHSSIPRPGPYKFEAYDTGPDNARVVTYRKRTKQHLLILTCFQPPPEDHHPAVCNNESRLDTQNELIYHLYEDQLKDAEAIDEGFRQLIKSFQQRSAPELSENRTEGIRPRPDGSSSAIRRGAVAVGRDDGVAR